MLLFDCQDFVCDERRRGGLRVQALGPKASPNSMNS